MKLTNVIFLIGLTLLSITKEAIASNSENGHVIQECKSLNSNCDITYISSTNKKSIILENYPFESIVKHHTDDIVEIISSCGSPCRSSIFINLKTNEIDSINMPIAFSEKYSVIAYTDQHNLILKTLFTSNKTSLEVDFSPVSVLENAIVNIEFLSKSSIKLTYLTTDKYIEKTKTFIYVP